MSRLRGLLATAALLTLAMMTTCTRGVSLDMQQLVWRWRNCLPLMKSEAAQMIPATPAAEYLAVGMSMASWAKLPRLSLAAVHHQQSNRVSNAQRSHSHT